jgi:AmmeMemoRadiSam system protein B
MIRRSSFAGSWYPRDPVELRNLVEGFKTVTKTTPSTLAVLPHAGLYYSAAGIAPFFSPVNPSITHLLVVGPSHYTPLAVDQFITASFDSYETPLGVLEGFALGKPNPAHHSILQKEHSIEMVLPFIANTPKPPKVATALINQISSIKVLNELSEQLLTKHEDLAIISSSDFTHFGPRFGFSALPAEEVKKRDQKIAELLAMGEINKAFTFFTKEEHTICGWASALLVANIAKQRGMRGEVATYYTSNDIAQGDRDDFVAYASILWR